MSFWCLFVCPPISSRYSNVGGILSLEIFRKSVQADLGTIAKRCELMAEAMRSRTEDRLLSQWIIEWGEVGVERCCFFRYSMNMPQQDRLDWNWAVWTWIDLYWYANDIWFGLSPLPVRVTTRIITFLVGNPYEPSFPLLLGGGTTQYMIIYDLYHMYRWWNHCALLVAWFRRSLGTTSRDPFQRSPSRNGILLWWSDANVAVMVFSHFKSSFLVCLIVDSSISSMLTFW